MMNGTGTQSERSPRYGAGVAQAAIEAEVAYLNARRGRLVAERRKALGLSQGKLSRLIDVDQTAISLIERGKSGISIRMAVLLAPVLDLAVESLLIGIDLAKHGLDFQVARAEGAS